MSRSNIEGESTTVLSDLALACLGDDTGGEDAGSRLFAASDRDFLMHTLDAHVGVIIESRLALGATPIWA
jgi:hypothetical protein